jgi:hypothetical protein
VARGIGDKDAKDEKIETAERQQKDKQRQDSRAEGKKRSENK